MTNNKRKLKAAMTKAIHKLVIQAKSNIHTHAKLMKSGKSTVYAHE